MKIFLYLLVFFGLVLLQGCGSAVVAPYRFIAPSYSDDWQPCGPEGIPIPSCALMDPFQCLTCYPEEGKMTLCELVDLGLRNSQKTRQSWADAKIAATDLAIQEATYFPDINFEAFIEFLRTSAYFGASLLQLERYTDYGPSVNLSYLLFDGGTRREKTEMFRQQLWEANWTHNREIQTVVQTIMSQYYETTAWAEQVVAAEANLKDANTTLLATEKKHQAGISDLSDVLIAQTQVCKQQNLLLDDTQNWKDAIAEMKLDIGIPANTPMEIEPLGDIEELNVIDPDANAYIAESYLSRPDLFASFSQVKAQISNVKAAIRNQYPTFQMDGSYGSTFFNGGINNDYDYSLQFTFSVPVFKGFEYKNAIRKAEAKLELSRAEMRELELEIIEQVVQSHQDFLLAVEKVKTNRIYLRTAELSFQSTLSKYRAGTTDITTVVNALADLADARSSLVTARKSWFSSLMELAYATGSLGRPCWR